MSNDQQHRPVVPSKKPRPVTDESGRRKNAALRARRLADKKADAMPVVAASETPRQVRTVDAPLSAPAPTTGVLAVLRQPYMLRLLVRREIAKMYSASILGLFWSYIQPAIRFATYYLIFGVILNAHDDVANFAIHLFCGLVFTHFFGEVFGGSTRSIWSNRTLVQKMPIPREIFPISHVIVGFYHIFPQVLLLVFFCVLSGFSIDLTGVICLILGLVTITVFASAAGLLFSAVNVYYRDFQNIVGTITNLMHFMVPMMYAYARIEPISKSHPILYQLYMGNPVADSVILVQRFFWYGVNAHDKAQGTITAQQRPNLAFPPDLILRGGITLVACLVFLLWCQRVFTRLEAKFPERI